MKDCYGKFAGGIKPIWAGPRMIICWWIGSIEPKALARSRVILESTSVKFKGRGINVLVRPKETFLDISADVNNCCFLLSM